MDEKEIKDKKGLTNRIIKETLERFAEFLELPDDLDSLTEDIIWEEFGRKYIWQVQNEVFYRYEDNTEYLEKAGFTEEDSEYLALTSHRDYIGFINKEDLEKYLKEEFGKNTLEYFKDNL